MSFYLYIDVTIWSTKGNEINMILKKSAIDVVRKLLQENNISYAVVIKDMQKLIEQENPAPGKIMQLQKRNGS